jgi:hypothetical protein
MLEPQGYRAYPPVQAWKTTKAAATVGCKVHAHFLFQNAVSAATSEANQDTPWHVIQAGADGTRPDGGLLIQFLRRKPHISAEIHK